MQILMRASLSSLLFMTSGCASMMESWRAQECNKEGAYQHGMNDAREAKPMNSGYATQCPANSQELVRQGYREGYTAGAQANKPVINPGGLININIGTSGSPASFQCTSSAFTSKFTGQGPSETEARAAAMKACKAKYHEMHCEIERCGLL